MKGYCCHLKFSIPACCDTIVFNSVRSGSVNFLSVKICNIVSYSSQRRNLVSSENVMWHDNMNSALYYIDIHHIVSLFNIQIQIKKVGQTLPRWLRHDRDLCNWTNSPARDSVGEVANRLAELTTLVYTVHPLVLVHIRQSFRRWCRCLLKLYTTRDAVVLVSNSWSAHEAFIFPLSYQLSRMESTKVDVWKSAIYV